MIRPLTLAFLATIALGSATAADSYTLDDAHSFALFKVSHLGISSTWGRFNDISGSFTWDKTTGVGNLTLTVKIDSVDTHNEKRDQHLKQADFFNAKQFPTATFTSTRWIKTSETTYSVTGDLTLHGVTKSITAPVTLAGHGDTPWKDHRVGLDSTITFKRSDFGMADKLAFAGDEVTLVMAVEGVRK